MSCSAHLMSARSVELDSGEVVGTRDEELQPHHSKTAAGWQDRFC